VGLVHLQVSTRVALAITGFPHFVSVLVYVHRNHQATWTFTQLLRSELCTVQYSFTSTADIWLTRDRAGEPRTATSTFTHLLSSGFPQKHLVVYERVQQQVTPCSHYSHLHLIVRHLLHLLFRWKLPPHDWKDRLSSFRSRCYDRVLHTHQLITSLKAL